VAGALDWQLTAAGHIEDVAALPPVDPRVVPAGTTRLLLLYCCFTTALCSGSAACRSPRRARRHYKITAALLLRWYCCFTTALCSGSATCRPPRRCPQVTLYYLQMTLYYLQMTLYYLLPYCCFSAAVLLTCYSLTTLLLIYYSVLRPYCPRVVPAGQAMH
jgi:hypothetical protein